MWDVVRGVLLATFYCDDYPKCCAVADGGAVIVAGDNDGRVHFLCLEEPQRGPDALPR